MYKKCIRNVQGWYKILIMPFIRYCVLVAFQGTLWGPQVDLQGKSGHFSVYSFPSQVLGRLF